MRSKLHNGICTWYMNGIINALSLWKSGGQNVDFTADNSLPLMLSFDRQPLIIFRVLSFTCFSVTTGYLFKGATLSPPFVGSTSEGERFGYKL
jgi:hypothetical protein